MDTLETIRIQGLDGIDLQGKRVLFRPDINSPIDKETKQIVNTNRLEKAAITLKRLLEEKAKVAIIAHQGDTLDYQNLIAMEEHAHILSELTGFSVAYIDDVCGPAAIEVVRNLKSGEAILLGNLRYLTEEVTAFEKEVKLTAQQMQQTYLVRSLASEFDLYVNDAFAAAHRNSPSMVAFQEILPTAGGEQLVAEYTALSSIATSPKHPCVFVLGGAKISDAFGMMHHVLENHVADTILCGGVTAQVMLIAQGITLGKAVDQFLSDRDLTGFIEEARNLLQQFPDKIAVPVDLAYEEHGKRTEASVEEINSSPALQKHLFYDLGRQSIDTYRQIISEAATIFINGPAGVYEDPRWEVGTKDIWQAIADAPGYTVVGGGDTITAAAQFTDLNQYSYVCTAGGAMIRFLSGKKLPLIQAMEAAYQRYQGAGK
jgi:phosphoglycerate kinase